MGDSLKIGKSAATAGKATGIVAPVADAPAPESSALVLVPPSPVATRPNRGTHPGILRPHDQRQLQGAVH